jgi:hypothetical protein
MTIPAVIAGQPIDPTTFGNAVASKLNDIPNKITAGSTTGTTDGSGDLTITHGHGSTPSFVLVTPRSTNVSQGYSSAVGASTFKFRCFSAAGAALTSASVTVNWLAITN